MNLPPDHNSGDPMTNGGLPPRQETFLAHYPRKYKLAAAGALLVVLISPFFMGGEPKKAADTAQKEATVKTEVAKATPEKTATTEAPKPNTGTDTTPASNMTLAADVVTDAAVIAINDTNDRDARMAHAPVPKLTEDTAEGSLPKIGEDGSKPWQVYARPFNNADKRPRIAIVMMGMGMSRVETDAALQKLPANVTLAFDVQNQVVGAWLGRARQDGHETLLSLPMEPFDYPRSDPGPNTLLTNLPNSDNLQRLLWALRQGSGYVGVTTLSGSRFITNPSKLTPILDILKQRGLMIFDTRIVPHSAVRDLAKSMGVPVATNTQRIDDAYSPDSIDAALTQLEQTARLNGRAVGLALPLPVTIDRLENWIKQLPAHGIALAPLSAMVE